MEAPNREVIWNDYFLYRASVRNLDLSEIERIMRHSSERYVDASTGRRIAVGKIKNCLMLIAYDLSDTAYEPVTAHSTTRQQIGVRLASGRYVYETA